MTSLRPGVALVVIGRNPGPDLPRLLAAASAYPFAETIFVDSGSSDDSGKRASAAGASVLTLPHSLAGAAAARAAGTLAATGDWILYLDSDMVPDIAAVSRVHGMLQSLSRDVAGVAGIIRDRYPDGTTRNHDTGQTSGARAIYFGGAVLLRRQAVLDAGNWNGRVMANEELDLHARLRAGGSYVRWEQVVLVDHYTAHLGFMRKLAMLLNWNGFRYGAPGLALRSAISRGAGFHLIALNPEPFVTLPLTLIALGMSVRGLPLVGLVVLLALWGWIGWRRGIRYLVPSYLLFPQIIVGAIRYGRR